MSAAEKIVIPQLIVIEDRQDQENVIEAPNCRAAAVAKFREIADKLERGELDGASVRWCYRQAEVQMRRNIQVVSVRFERENDDRRGFVRTDMYRINPTAEYVPEFRHTHEHEKE